MATIKAVIVDPDGEVRKTEIENSLAPIQAVVGGYIEGVFGDDCTIYVNEEGIILSLPYNPSATLFANKFVAEGHTLFGTVLIVGPPDGHGNDTSVHESVVSYYSLED